MVLPYGAKNGRLIHISEVKSGKTELVCPYCNSPLSAKKGKVMTHHFAHLGDSCFSINANLFFGFNQNLPLHLTLVEATTSMYQNIRQRKRNLIRQQQWLQRKQNQLQSVLREGMQQLKVQPNSDPVSQKKLLVYQQIRNFIWNEQSVLPDTSFLLPDFSTFVQALAQYHPTRYKILEINQKIALYEQDLDYFQRFSLYFLKIQSSDYHLFYKIGLTSRTLKERISEIEAERPTYVLHLRLKSNP